VVVEEAKLRFTVESGWGNKEEILEAKCHKKVKAVSSIAFR
jgi:hypothetical protein